MSTKTIQCREHSGTFEIEAKRGRPPVKCSVDNPCSRAPEVLRPNATSTKRQEANAARTLSEWRKAAKDAGFSAAVINKMRTPAMFRELLGSEPGSPEREKLVERKPRQTAAQKRQAELIERTKATQYPTPKRGRNAAAVKELAKTTRGTTPQGEAAIRKAYMDELAAPAPVAPNKAPQSHANGRLPRVATSPSLAKAKVAKEALEAQGWVCVGKGKGDQATLTCSRGEETLILNFSNGELVEQNYSLWNVDKPAENNIPNNKLSFDPDEMTDSELIRALSGMKVVWWNKLASNTETATVGPNKIVIEHCYAGNGEETPADRIVKFTDHTRQGDGISGRMRAFRLGALLKVS